MKTKKTKNKDNGIFEDLKTSLQEVLEIERGNIEPVSFVEVESPKRIREKLGLSQPKFAEFVGVRVATLRNWEQGRRRIPSTAKTLLRIAERHPDVILELANI